MTNKIMFSTDYVGVVTVGLYYTTSDSEFSYYQTSADIEVGIVTASDINVTGIVSASEFRGNFIGTVAGTASTASFAATAFNLQGIPDINVGIITASSFVGDVTGTASTALGLSGEPNISVGVVTATGGFISSGSTTPVQINFDVVTNSITFSVVGFGTTSLILF